MKFVLIVLLLTLISCGEPDGVVIYDPLTACASYESLNSTWGIDDDSSIEALKAQANNRGYGCVYLDKLNEGE